MTTVEAVDVSFNSIAGQMDRRRHVGPSPLDWVDLIEFGADFSRNGLDSLQRGSGAHGRNGRDPAVDQEVCPNDVRRIVRREVNCPLRDSQRIRDPLAWIVGSEDALNRLALLFSWEATEHRRVRRAWA